MEKKTIGKLISVLRRANGMTQKELGEKLFVSDKTISRWECDECTPELSLIPVIAELFGVTTDELLRGECNHRTADANAFLADEERRAQIKAQNDKLVRRILHKKYVRYKNLSMISIGIAIVGLIVAMICNLGFYRGILGFCLASVLYLAGTICQCWFTTSARYLYYDEEDHSHDDMIARANSDIIGIDIKVLCVILALFAFTLPIAILTDGAFTGLNFGSWLLFGVVFAAGSVILMHILYILCVRKLLIDKAWMITDTRKNDFFRYQRKLLIKCSAVVTAVAVVFGIGYWVVSQFGYDWFRSPIVFDNYRDFVAYMDDLAEQNQGGMANNTAYPGTSAPEEVIADTETLYQWETVCDANGNVLCKFKRRWSVSNISFSFDTSEDGLPVYVITQGARIRANNMTHLMQGILVIGIIFDIMIGATVYTVICTRKKRTFLVK